MTKTISVPVELLEQVTIELEHDNDRYMLGRELRALLATAQPASSVGGEEIQVVGVRISSAGFGSYIADSAMGLGTMYPGDVRDPLMTVAQHQRITAARAAELAAIKGQKPIAWRWAYPDGNYSVVYHGADGPSKDREAGCLPWTVQWIYAMPAQSQDVSGLVSLPEGWSAKRVHPEDGIGFVIKSPRSEGASAGTAVWSDAESPAEQLLALMLAEVIHEAC